jgi:hypothetical protein
MDRLAEIAPVLAPDAMLPRVVRVARRTRDLPDTWTLDLVAADGAASPSYAPGQFTMMYFFGAGEIPVLGIAPCRAPGTFPPKGQPADESGAKPRYAGIRLTAFRSSRGYPPAGSRRLTPNCSAALPPIMRVMMSSGTSACASMAIAS